MKCNVGGIDRALRVVGGACLVALGFADIGVPWTFLGVVPLATGLIGWCPVYPLLGISTGCRGKCD